MGLLKVAGAVVAVLVALFVVSAVIHTVIWVAFAALFVGAIVLIIKAATHKKQVAPGLDDKELAKPAPRPRQADVDAELAALKRKMGS
jgi:hypothetical protein